MRETSSSYRSVILIMAATALIAAGVRADDIDLFRTTKLNPNVLVVLDSGGTTTQNPNNDTHFLDCGDDPNAKLPQEKEVLKWFFDEYPDFNYGFSFSCKVDPGDALDYYKVHYLDYLYQVVTVVPDNASATGYASPFLQMNQQIRMGDDWDYWHGPNQQRTPVFPIRYGLDGTEDFYAYTGNASVGTKAARSYIIDDAGNRKVATAPPYYYPAIDWTKVPAAIQDGLSKAKTWNQVSVQLKSASRIAIAAPDAGWEKALRDYVLPLMQAAQFPDSETKTIRVREVAATCQAANKGVCTRWADDVPLKSQITTLTYVNHFLLYDRPYYGDDTQQINASTSMTALEWKNPGIDCNNGYTESPDSGSSEYRPIVPVPLLDSANNCAQPDQREWIKSFLGRQTTPMFYVPNGPAPYLPVDYTGYIPWTDTVMAGGRRPLAKILYDSRNYFEYLNSLNNSCMHCRDNYLIIFTDGLESCAGGQNVCQQGLLITNATVYAIAYFPEKTDATQALYDQAEQQLACATKPSGGTYLIASNLDDLKDAFGAIGQLIRERTYAFASPSVPSVELSTKEKGYISSFFAVNYRSVWEGHLRAFAVDQSTGLIPLATDPNTGLLIPDVTRKLWDAADTLSTIDNANVVANSTSDGRRRFYFGTDAASGVPGTREAFQVGTGSVSGSDVELWNRIFEPATPVDATTLTATDRDNLLKPIVDFTRGVRADATVYQYPYDATTPTGLGRLGDVFHSVPAIVGRPDCFQCWQGGKTGYADYLSTNLWRRKVLFAGADDGAMHAFDAGFFECVKLKSTDSVCTPQYDDGTGKEMFAWVPNAVMPTLNLLANDIGHQYTADGSPTIADVYIDPTHSGTPTAAERQWRTVLLFGLRQGGQSVTCLDVTQPDTLQDETIDGQLIKDVPQSLTGTDRLPSCLAGSSSTACGNKDYPRLLWEFTDNGVDAYGNHDLGHTWSKPAVAIVKVKVPGGTSPADDEERYVAIFGGGYELQTLADNTKTWGGDYLYIVDIETGKTLLKLPTGIPSGGAVPGEVGILDANLDGIPERLYWTDTEGSFWRMDMSAGAAIYDTSSGRVQCSWVDDDTYNCGLPASGTGGWTVKRFFKNTDGTYQPIFHRPVIVQIGTDGSGATLYGVGAGSGDREDILSENPYPHRFYFLRDPGGTSGLPLTVADLQEVTLGSTATTNNLLFSNGTSNVYGWYLTLDQFEKVNTPAVTIEGQLIFSTFTPSSTISVDCQGGGLARTYVLDYRNANPVPGATSRYSQFPGAIMMASEPIVYVGEDGRVHVLQSTDALALSEPIAPIVVRGNLMSWREK